MLITALVIFRFYRAMQIEIIRVWENFFTFKRNNLGLLCKLIPLFSFAKISYFHRILVIIRRHNHIENLAL